VSSICVIEREERHAAPSFLEPKKKGGNIVPQKCANNNQDEKEEEDPADLPPTAPRAPPNATFWTPQAKLRYQALMRAAAQEEAYGRQKEALCSKKIVDAAGDFVVAVTADKKVRIFSSKIF
jgi:hypothetical protein